MRIEVLAGESYFKTLNLNKNFKRSSKIFESKVIGLVQ